MTSNPTAFYYRCGPCQRERELAALSIRFRVEALEDIDNPEDLCNGPALRWINAQLAGGNRWAWCTVQVTARWEFSAGGVEGSALLGACSYRSEADFRRPGGHFNDMRTEALHDLAESVRLHLYDHEDAQAAALAREVTLDPSAWAPLADRLEEIGDDELAEGARLMGRIVAE